MPFINVDVEKLIQFFIACSNDSEIVAGFCNACQYCPVRKECDYYYTGKGEAGALAGIDL